MTSGHPICDLVGKLSPPVLDDEGAFLDGPGREQAETRLGTTDAEVFKPWINHALEEFGIDRCFFGSNFPPDSGNSTFDELYTTYATLTADLGPDDREKLFASNASLRKKSQAAP